MRIRTNLEANDNCAPIIFENTIQVQPVPGSLVIFPGGIVRAIAHAAQPFYATLRADGTTDAARSAMLDFEALNRTIGTPASVAERSPASRTASHRSRCPPACCWW